LNSEENNRSPREDEQDRETPQAKPGFRQLLISILGAALGVQSDKNRQKDFNSPSPTPYIVGGIIFGAIFVAVIALVVALVMRSVG